MKIKLKYKSGDSVVIDKELLRSFLLENGIPYKDYLEYKVREKLGQKFTHFNDYIDFKKQNTDSDNKSEHLRFEMCGQRDGEGGLQENIEIFKLFNLPITLRGSYDDLSYKKGDLDNIFIFHKGSPILFKRLPNKELEEVYQYNGYGTVEILVELIEKFGATKFLDIE